MAKNYFGVVLTTKEHDKYRLVVYRYKDPGILNTCPMCQLLRAIHKFQQEYTEIHREHCSRIPPRKWYELGRVMPSIVLRNTAWKSITRCHLSRVACLQLLR